MNSIRWFVVIAAFTCASSTSVRALGHEQQQQKQGDDKDDDDPGPWPHPHFYWSHGIHLDDIFGFDLSLGGDGQNDSANYANTDSVD